jgi:hypothetical protein
LEPSGSIRQFTLQYAITAHHCDGNLLCEGYFFASRW